MAADLGRRLVDVIAEHEGAHPGFRAAHAKGRCFDAAFQATPEVAALTTAAHLQGQDVAAVVRFSAASPKPDAADWAQDVGGMAVKFLLPDGRETDIVAINLPVFFVRDPEHFIEFTKARYSNPKLLGFALRHPESWRALAYAARHRPRVMAGRWETTYFGIHAFRWTAPDGAQVYVRYELQPESGERTITRAEARARGRDFLNTDLAERLQDGPVGFQLVLQVADPSDAVDDPTRPWPRTRRRVSAGRLEIRGLSEDQDAGCERRVFDPTHVIEGIECSHDPVLAARREAYSVSIERRLAGR